MRSAYAEGNIVARNTDFDLVAITDTSKTEVRFEIVSGSPATGAYTTTSYEEESQVSSYGLPTNNVHVFRRTVQFTAAGTYTVRAYSRSSSSASWSSDYYEFTVQVTSTNVSAPPLRMTSAAQRGNHHRAGGLEALSRRLRQTPWWRVAPRWVMAWLSSPTARSTTT